MVRGFTVLAIMSAIWAAVGFIGLMQEYGAPYGWFLGVGGIVAFTCTQVAYAHITQPIARW